jgi:hypothetical protein
VKWLDFAFGQSPREDLDRLSVEMHGGDRGVRSQDIGILMDRRTGKSIVETPV